MRSAKTIHAPKTSAEMTGTYRLPLFIIPQAANQFHTLAKISKNHDQTLIGSGLYQ